MHEHANPHGQRCQCDVDPTCADCGVDTNEIGEYYMVHDRLWRRAIRDRKQRKRQMCVGCLERRLGRNLNRKDFTSAPINLEIQEFSPRLFDRILTEPLPSPGLMWRISARFRILRSRFRNRFL